MSRLSLPNRILNGIITVLYYSYGILIVIPYLNIKEFIKKLFFRKI